jgi:hypothetical protein
MHSTRRLVLTQIATAGLAALLVLAISLIMAPDRTAAVAPAVASGLLPRFINLSPSEAHLDGDAAFSGGGGAASLAGIYLPNTTFSRVHISFTLPPDYNPGSDLTLRIVWANGPFNAINCAFDFWSSAVQVARPGAAGNAYAAATRFSNGSDQITLDAGATPLLFRAEELTIQGSDGAKALQPGDALYVQVARRGDLAADTCAGSLVISGLGATYAGLTTYVPLIRK